jgi:hypothetical protein
MEEVPVNCRRIIGSLVFCQADRISASEYMLFWPKKKKERSGNWWQKKEYIK